MVLSESRIDLAAIAVMRLMLLSLRLSLVGSPSMLILKKGLLKRLLDMARIEIDGKIRRTPPKKSMPSSVNS